MKTFRYSLLAIAVFLCAGLLSLQAEAKNARVITGVAAKRIAHNAKARWGFGTDVYVYNHSDYFVDVEVPEMDLFYTIAPYEEVDFHDDDDMPGVGLYFSYDFDPYTKAYAYVDNGGTADIWNPDFVRGVNALNAGKTAKVKVTVQKAK